MNREELVNDFNTKSELYDKVKEDTISQIKSIFDNFINREISTSVICRLEISDPSRFELIVEDSTHSYSIDFYFRKFYDTNDDNYKLGINYPSFGTFKNVDKLKVEFIRILGKVASYIDYLEYQIKKIDWEDYNTKCLNMVTAEWDLRNFDKKVEEENHNKLLEELSQKLIVGSKIKVGQTYDWCSRKYSDDIRVVKKIMPKTIEFEGYHNRSDKAYCLENLVNNIWSFV